MFFINYLDRSAIGFAGPNGMNDDLALTVTQVGFASGVFFIGYILLEVPSNLALARFGARRWLARIMVTWGIVAVLFTWVGSFEHLAILRFALGVAEAGFFPEPSSSSASGFLPATAARSSHCSTWRSR
jgi:MFS family permease